MSDYKSGQRVKVTFEGVVGSVFSNGGMEVDVPDSTFGVFIAPEDTGVEIEILGPADWPPQVGDIWEADGAEYFVRQYGKDDLHVGRFDGQGGYSDSHSWSSDRNLDAFKALNPVLVRRRGQ